MKNKDFNLKKGFNYKKAFLVLLIFVLIGSFLFITSKTNNIYDQDLSKLDNFMAINLQKTKGCTTNNSSCYDISASVPASGYTLNKTNSYCTNGTTTSKDTSIPIDYTSGTINIGITKDGTKCFIYLDKA